MTDTTPLDGSALTSEQKVELVTHIERCWNRGMSVEHTTAHLVDLFAEINAGAITIGVAYCFETYARTGKPRQSDVMVDVKRSRELVIGDVEPRGEVERRRRFIAPEWGDALAHAHVVGGQPLPGGL